MRWFICCWLIAIASVSRAEDADQPLPPHDAAASMAVPEGFRVSLFAAEPDVMQPIGFCVDDRGRLWVAEAYNYPSRDSKSADRIVILEDSDGDGEHDERTVFFEGLSYVSGIEVGFGGAWVMSPPNMFFIPDADGDDQPDGEPRVVLDGFGTHANAHNMANGFAWGPDGWLYATHGRTNWSLIGKPSTAEQDRIRFDGGVWRYHPIRDVWEPYADGTTNPWGIDWNDYGHAFISNCVNPHLFQVIQGAHYEPGRGRKSSQYAYQRIDTIADHLHFVGLGNPRNGLGSDAEDAAGGGHAHSGTMIYLGDQFHDSYRNQLFTNNIHGRRINNDLLRRNGSGYTASHGPDLMRSKDPWFMGVTLAYGPSGEVYVSDWSDTGECHSTRNTRKHTGRIFRITYLKTQLESVRDVRRMDNSELVKLQQHDNDWWVRHARRVLQERSRSSDMQSVHSELRQQFDQVSATPKKLRALWALAVTGGLRENELLALLDHADEHLRSWAITLICEGRSPKEREVEKLVFMAQADASSLVQLSLANAAQRLSPSDRWPLVESLATANVDSQDPNLPLMIWYAVEPLIDDDLPRYVRLACEAKLSRVRTNMARRVASSSKADEGLELLSQQLAEINAAENANFVSGNLLEGIVQGLEGTRKFKMPKSWRAAAEKMASTANSDIRERLIRLSLVFDDPLALKSLLEVAGNSEANATERICAIEALVAKKVKGFGEVLLRLVDDPVVRPSALRGLMEYEPADTAETILARLDSWIQEHRQLAITTLASRKRWAFALLSAIEKKQVPVSDLTAFSARQIDAFDDSKLSAQLTSVWGEVRESPKNRAKEIAKLKSWLTPSVIAKGNSKRGSVLFKNQCGKCHRFFGEGGTIGPDITGTQRTNIDYMLENIVDPSASVSKDYQTQLLLTTDGRLISGLIESENDRTVTIATVDDRISIPVDEIESRKVQPTSIMPDEMLTKLSDADIRDLFAYLQRVN